MTVPSVRLAGLIPPELPRPEGFAALVWAAERHLDPRRLFGFALGKLSRMILRRADALQALSDEDLFSRVIVKRNSIRRSGTVRYRDTVEALALLAETASRTTGMRPYPEQIWGAIAVRHRFIVEMQTGEGKSLTACIAAALSAWTGKPCHILTANIYLAVRDATKFADFYNACGLTVSAVRDTDPKQARQTAYTADVVYTTAKEMLGDLLRDAILLGPRPRRAGLSLQMLRSGNDGGPTLRGLGTAIVDEADSLLIDDAVTPLIIAEEVPRAGFDDAIRAADAISDDLTMDVHIHHDHQSRRASLTQAGVQQLSDRLSDFKPPWSEPAQARHLVDLALTARFMLQRGRHYVVYDDKIILLDEQTGRRAIGRTLSGGLHQALEVSEGVLPSSLTEITGRRSFQRFFRLFPHLAGLTGTAAEASGELWGVYGLPVMKIPTHWAPARQVYQTMLHPTEAAKLTAVAAEAQKLSRAGRPVLIGTRSIGTAEHLHAALIALECTPRLLTAMDEAAEADIVATAGVGGTITIATNMAGRGTDIVLEPHVSALGGLHVVIAEANDLARIDRQMAGRAARQGDRGSVRIFLTPEDLVFQRALSPRARGLLCWLAYRPSAPHAACARIALWLSQRRAARLGIVMRRTVLAGDLKFEGSGL